MLSKSKYDSLFETYGCYRGNGLTYIKTHFKRYVETLELIKEYKSVSRILELGASDPFAFTIMLKDAFPLAEIKFAQYREPAEHHIDHSPEHTMTLKSLNNINTKDLTFELQKFNAEKDIWPYEDNFFDVVLCMEILEHLLLDPCMVFREANRVLKKGGILIATTPNIACYESIENLIHSRSPYTYGVYSSHGEYGRHNREFVPQEVKELGDCSGFESISLTTKDVYDYKVDISTTKRILDTIHDNQHMRGQTIFYKGMKTGKVFTSYPDALYDFQPDYHCAEIHIINLDTIIPEGSSIHVELIITNRGQYTSGAAT